MERNKVAVGQQDAVLAFAGGLLLDPVSGRQRVKTCLSGIPNVLARRFIDVPPCGLVVPMNHAAEAAAALPMVARHLARLSGDVPSVAMFQLPSEQDRLQRFLIPAAAKAGSGGVAVQLRGLDLDAHWRETPVWGFGTHRGEVIGCDVRVSLDVLSKQLDMPDLMATAREEPIAAALAQALLRSLANPRNARQDQLFVRVPAGLLASPETWRLLATLPGGTLAKLVVVLEDSGPAGIEEGVIEQLREIGVAVCLTDIDWSRGAAVYAPNGVGWVRGPVRVGMDILRIEMAVAVIGRGRAIADIGADQAHLHMALAAGFRHAAGSGVQRPCAKLTMPGREPAGPCPAGLPRPKCLQRSWSCLRRPHVLESPAA